MVNQHFAKPVSEYELKLLKIFVAIVEHGGFSQAAVELGITQSTISLHMSNLEGRLGYKLCHRGRAGFSLTKHGSDIYQGVMKLNQSLNEFTALVNNLGQELTGEIIILCSEQLDADKQIKLAKVLSFLNEAHPKLQLSLDQQPVTQIEQQLLADKVHVGFYPSHYQVEGLTYQELTNEQEWLYCGAEHPLFAKNDVDIDTKVISQHAAVHSGKEMNRVAREQINRLKVVTNSSQVDTRKAMLLSGKFIGFLPQGAVEHEEKTGQLRALNPEKFNFDVSHSLVHKSKPMNPQKLDLIKQAFAFAFG